MSEPSIGHLALERLDVHATTSKLSIQLSARRHYSAHFRYQCQSATWPKQSHLLSLLNIELTAYIDRIRWRRVFVMSSPHQRQIVRTQFKNHSIIRVSLAFNSRYTSMSSAHNIFCCCCCLWITLHMEIQLHGIVIFQCGGSCCSVAVVLLLLCVSVGGQCAEVASNCTWIDRKAIQIQCSLFIAMAFTLIFMADCLVSLAGPISPPPFTFYAPRLWLCAYLWPSITEKCTTKIDSSNLCLHSI